MTHSPPEGRGRGVGSRLLELQLFKPARGERATVSCQRAEGPGDRPTLSAASQRWEVGSLRLPAAPTDNCEGIMATAVPPRLQGLGLFPCVSIWSGVPPCLPLCFRGRTWYFLCRPLSCWFLYCYMSLYHFYFITYCDTKPFKL